MCKSDRQRVYFSRWLVSGESVIIDAALELDGSRITFVGTQSTYEASQSSELNQIQIIDLGSSVIIPGLVNCHVHTNFPAPTGSSALSFESGSMVSWVQAALAERATRSESEQVQDVQSALARLQATGTVAIGEIANDFVSLESIVDSGMYCRFFAEGLGFPDSLAGDISQTLKENIASAQRSMAESNKVSIHPAPHAPYSSSAKLIQNLIGSTGLSTIHLAENREEVELLATGAGPWRERLAEIGKDDPTWIAPEKSPVEYLEALDVLREGLLLIHVVHASESDIKLIAQSGATVVLCPSSNAFINVGAAPLDKFLANEIPLGLGTDSLASNADLDLFAEMRLLRELFPSVSSRTLFSMATSGGAEALGFADELGVLRVDSSPGVFVIELGAKNDSLDFKTDEELFERLITVGSSSLRKLANVASA